MRELADLDKFDTDFLGSIDNIAFRPAGGGVRVNTIRCIEDLDAVPLPAWDLMDPRTYPVMPHGTFVKAFPIAPVITSRGCLTAARSARASGSTAGR